jgi:uncharacterized protein (TIGR02217 family)
LAFINQQFPCGVSIGSISTIERRTDVVVTSNGFEERNSKWANSRKSFDASYGIKTLDLLGQVISLFEEARGRLHTFRYRDFADYKSCLPSIKQVQATDQILGLGDGNTYWYRLRKSYGTGQNVWWRYVTKPVSGSILVAVNGVMLPRGPSGDGGDYYVVDEVNGFIGFYDGVQPGAGVVLTAGFEYDLETRFNTDRLAVSVQAVLNGTINNIPLVEVRHPLVPLPAEPPVIEVAKGIMLEDAVRVGGRADGYWTWEDGTVIEWG